MYSLVSIIYCIIERKMINLAIVPSLAACITDKKQHISTEPFKPENSLAASERDGE